MQQRQHPLSWYLIRLWYEACLTIQELFFEIAIPEFGGSCGGGGRYDKMVGNFTGKDVPACGFSIGFERIVMLLLESGYQVPGKQDKKAYLLDKKAPERSSVKGA